MKQKLWLVGDTRSDFCMLRLVESTNYYHRSLLLLLMVLVTHL